MRSNTSIMGCITKIFLLAACLSLGSAQEDDLLLRQVPQEVLFKQNVPVRIDCVVARPTKKEVKYSWYKNGKPLTLDSKHIVPDHRKNVLVFTDPSDETEGKYQCYAKSDAGVTRSGIFTLKRTFIELPTEVTQTHIPVEGEHFKLDCPQVKAYPKPSIVWMLQHGLNAAISHTILDARITQGPDGALYFTNITKDDVSENFKYVCIASSPALEKPTALASHYIKSLTVNKNTGSKKLVPMYLSTEVVVKKGDTAFLYCIYGGTPLASPDWFLKGKNVNNGGNDRITAHNRSKGKRFLIRDARLSDAGVYTCKVKEADGSITSHNIKLIVQPVLFFETIPGPPKMVKEGEKVEFTCSVKGQAEGAKEHYPTWSFNAESLEKNKNWVADTTKKENEMYTKLSNKKVTKKDAGYYGCSYSDKDLELYFDTLLSVV